MVLAVGPMATIAAKAPSFKAVVRRVRPRQVGGRGAPADNNVVAVVAIVLVHRDVGANVVPGAAKIVLAE